MSPFLPIAAAAALFYFLTRDEKPQKDLTLTGPGGATVDPLLYQVPGYAALPAEVQQQINWVAAHGTSTQIRSLANALEKSNPANKLLADALRTIAAKKG